MGFFKGDPTGDDEKVIDALVKLGGRLVREITTEQSANIPKMLWKMTSVYQCLIRRTIEAADGLRSAWGAENLLTTITMARSLFETGAIVSHLTNSIRKATEAKDLEALDRVIMQARSPQILKSGSRAYACRPGRRGDARSKRIINMSLGHMRKIIVLSFISLDGVIQAPGGPEEDPTGSFTYGGWSVPYFDEYVGKAMVEQMSRPFDLLLGRKTYEIFAAHWPYQKIDEDPIAAAINNATKYVVSRSSLQLGWDKSMVLRGDVIDEIKRLKQQDGPELQVHGSGNLIQTLLRHDLIDELWLKIFPLTLGLGKRLFANGTTQAAFALRESKTSSSGVIIAAYERAGTVKTGSFAMEKPTAAELTRRQRMREEN